MASAQRWEGHPPLPPDLTERLTDVVARLRRAGARLIYLFGSGALQPATGGAAAGDLDLAVLGTSDDTGHLRADLEEILATDRLDLVRLEDADPELRFHIVTRGRLLHAVDRDLENRVELAILREYRDLAPLRDLQRRYLRARAGVDGP